MRVIGVIDLLGGQAVHARAGRREDYEPVRSVAGAAILPGDPVALARAYLDRFGIRELYVADLDAILGISPQQAIVTDIVELGAPIWLDAGVASVGRARLGASVGASHVVVGLETLRSFEVLSEICGILGGESVTFSLDLRAGEPVVAPESGGISGMSASALAASAVAAGARSVIVLDLARIGTDAGVDASMLAGVRDAVPEVTLLAGGGIRGLEDLRGLARSGCDGALVASAILDGRLDALDIAKARGAQPSVNR